MHPHEVASRLESLDEALRQVPGVIFAYVFGSAASGAMTPMSDVDIAVHLDSTSDPIDARLAVFAAVSKHLATDRLDIVVLNTAPLALAGRVLTTRRVVVDDAPFVRHLYESVTARMFQDFRIREHRILAQRYAHG